MMNARLSELENVIAKSSSTPIGRGKNFDFKSKEEVNNIQEENRVVSKCFLFASFTSLIKSNSFFALQLTEAVDVLQREVEMYENEIRALKDFKSPKRGSAVSKSTPRRTSTAISDHSPAPRGAIDESHSTSSLEATLFRPALQQALHEAARWKTSATATAISDLPPLPILPFNIENETYIGGIAMGDCVRLSLAIAESRIHKASIALVDLTSSIKTPRAQLRDMAISNSIASQRLETAVMRYQGRLH